MVAETAVAVIEGGSALWRLADETGLLTKLRIAFQKKQKMLVLGRSGTGKTNLLVSLAASAGLVEAIKASDRTVRSISQKVLIKGRPFTVLDTPGQEQHEADRRARVLEVLQDADSKVRVINVVSYGFHEYGTAVDAISADGVAVSGYLENHRQREIDRLAEWIGVLGDRSTTAWVLTVVTKADLWWDQRDKVLAHYESGLYDETIRSQDPGIHHVVLPYCSVVHKFFGTSPVSGMFDDSDRLTINFQLLQKLVDLG